MPAAAADALGEDGVCVVLRVRGRGRVARRDRAGVGHRHRPGATAGAAAAAERQVQGLAVAEDDVAGDGEAATPATAADALRRDPDGLVAQRRDRRVVGKVDLCAVAATAPLAADRHPDVVFAEQGPRHAGSAVAAAAANALRIQAERLIPGRLHRPAVLQHHLVGTAGGTAIARHRDGEITAVLEIDCSGRGEGGIAAAAADAVRVEAARAVALRGDRGIAHDRHLAAGTTAPATTADRNREAGALRRGRDVDRKATVAAAAADALREDPERLVARCADAVAALRAGGRDRRDEHRPGATACLAAAADGGRRGTVGRSAEIDGEPAVTATAADALRDDAARCVALRGERDTRRRARRDGVAGPPGGARAADRHRESYAGSTRAAAVAPAAADALGVDRIRARERRADRVGVVDLDGAAAAAAATRAADGEPGPARAAVPSAAADALGEDAVRAAGPAGRVRAGEHRAAGRSPGGDDARVDDLHRAAARAVGRTATQSAERAARAAIAAGAADALRVNAVRVVARGGQIPGVRHGHRSAAAADAAGPALPVERAKSRPAAAAAAADALGGKRDGLVADRGDLGAAHDRHRTARAGAAAGGAKSHHSDVAAAAAGVAGHALGDDAVGLRAGRQNRAADVDVHGPGRAGAAARRPRTD